MIKILFKAFFITLICANTAVATKTAGTKMFLVNLTGIFFGALGFLIQ